MSTLNRALNRGSDNLEIRCRVVCIKVFCAQSSVFATALLLDANGEIIEAKSWTPNKSYYLHFNFQPNQSVTLDCHEDLISDSVNRKFSGADYQATGGPWRLLNCTHEVPLKQHFPVLTDIQRFHKSSAHVKSVAGEFVKMDAGPLKYKPNGRVLVRGRFVTLKDENNLLFQALVWANARRKFKFPLDDCSPGQMVLLPYAREQDEHYRSGSSYVVTTIYPPVLKLDFANIDKLAKKGSDKPVRIFNPYK